LTGHFGQACARLHADRQPGHPWLGTHDSNFGQQDPKSQWGGDLTALDADSGKIRWQLHTSTPLLGGVTATGDGLVFVAISMETSAPTTGVPASSYGRTTSDSNGGRRLSYQAGGRQHIAVAAVEIAELACRNGHGSHRDLSTSMRSTAEEI